MAAINPLASAAATSTGASAATTAASAAATAGEYQLSAAEQYIGYLVLCSAAWCAAIVFLRYVVLGKSKTTPVFRIPPDRREAREDMVTCEWLQVLVARAFRHLSKEIPSYQLRSMVSDSVNTIMHLSGGKFELYHLSIGDAPPQICGIEARRESDDRIVVLVDVFYDGRFTAAFGIERPVHLPLLGASMFPMAATIESISLQLRLHLVWDTSAHKAASPPDPHKASLHPSPATKSVVEVSFANLPDVSIKVKTEIGARHVISDSQVITSLLASLASRWLRKRVLHPNKMVFSFKMPGFMVPDVASAADPDHWSSMHDGASHPGKDRSATAAAAAAAASSSTSAAAAAAAASAAAASTGTPPDSRRNPQQQQQRSPTVPPVVPPPVVLSARSNDPSVRRTDVPEPLGAAGSGGGSESSDRTGSTLDDTLDGWGGRGSATQPQPHSRRPLCTMDMLRTHVGLNSVDSLLAPHLDLELTDEPPTPPLMEQLQ